MFFGLCLTLAVVFQCLDSNEGEPEEGTSFELSCLSSGTSGKRKTGLLPVLFWPSVYNWGTTHRIRVFMSSLARGGGGSFSSSSFGPVDPCVAIVDSRPSWVVV